MTLVSEEFMDPLTGPDYTIHTSMGLAQEQGWRRDTPPAGEDGSVPSVSLTVTDSSVGEGGPI